jgi:hypothetical protein
MTGHDEEVAARACVGANEKRRTDKEPATTMFLSIEYIVPLLMAEPRISFLTTYKEPRKRGSLQNIFT